MSINPFNHVTLGATVAGMWLVVRRGPRAGAAAWGPSAVPDVPQEWSSCYLALSQHRATSMALPAHRLGMCFPFFP